MSKDGINKVVILASDGQTYKPPTIGIPLDGLVNPSTGVEIISLSFLFNGSNWQRERSIEGDTFLISGSRTGDTFTANNNNINHRGISINVDVTVYGGDSITMILQNFNSNTSVYTTYLSFPPITSVGSFLFSTYPGHEISSVLPAVYRIGFLHSGPAAITYSARGSLLV